MSYIEFKNVSYAYTPETEAIDDISLNINQGEFITILGHNGSGKSTLAKLLVGLLACDSGTISIDGKIITKDSIYEIRENLGIVFQNPDNQFVGVTVKDDIAFGLENRATSRLDMEIAIDKYSKMVNMDKFLSRNPEQLSGGEKQRVAIAGILAMNPSIIIFDEATSMLDPEGVKEINEMIYSLKGTKTLIVITHNLNESLHSDRIIVMNKGKIVLDDKPSEVFKQTQILKDSHLDLLESMKLSELINNSNLKNKERLQKALWELTFKE